MSKDAATIEKLDPVRRLIVDRVRDLGTTLKDESIAIGRNHAYLQQFINRHSPRNLPEAERQKLAKRLRLDESELMTKEMRRAKKAASSARVTAVTSSPSATHDDDVKKSTILEVDVRAGAGGGGESALVYMPNDSGDMLAVDGIKAHWDLPTEYLRHELRVAPETARVIEIRGDSMSPTLESGDRVIVDTADRIPSPDGLFALWDGVGLVVKRLEFVPNSDPATFRIISDNKHHSMYERTDDELRVTGRVVWFARRI